MFGTLVKEKIKSLEGLLHGVAVLEATDNYCHVETDRVTIKLFCDERNDEVTSEIVWKITDPQYSDEMHTQIIARFFREIEREPQRSDLEAGVEFEIGRIKQIIEYCDARAVTPRDLFHFETGYVRAYNDYMSG